MKKKIFIILISVFIILTILVAVYISWEKTAVINPISSGINLLKIIYTDEPYLVAQNKPYKVMFAKTKYNEKTAQELLDEYMNEIGFYTDDRMGGMIIYKNGEQEERIYFSVNKYYSRWEWV